MEKGIDFLLGGVRCPKWVGFVIPVVLLVVPLSAPGGQGGPVRVEVESDRLEVPEGRQTPVTVRLVDAGGSPVAARRPFEIQVEIAWDEGLSKTIPVTFRKGESTKEVMVEAQGSGVVSVEATNEELLKGGTLLRVRPDFRMEPMLRELAEVELGESIPGENREHRNNRTPTIILPERIPETLPEEGLPRPDIGTAGSTESGEPSAGGEDQGEPAPEVGAAAGPGPLLEIRPFPDRPLRADGEDPAKIFAYLRGASGGSDVKLTFWRSRGQLQPTELRIPSGQTFGEAELTSDSPGTARVDLVSSRPQLEVTGQRELEFEFHPAVDALDIAAPATLDVGDSATLSVDLINVADTPIPTVVPRKIRFQVLAGKVRIRDLETEIPAGDSGVTTKITADWWGDAEIEISTPNLSKERISVAIGLPWGLLGVTALGGLLGGLIAWTHGPDKHQRLAMRLLLGFVAGLVLYWLLAYLAVPGTPDFVREVAVRNPLGAFGSTVVGGWLGTEVFEIVARRLGLIQASA